MFTGSLVALVTPMKRDGSIDKDALQRLIERHIEEKTDGIVVNGTTGEAATLTFDEQNDLIEMVVKQVNHRLPVIAGTGSNSTQRAIELTRQAQEIGADAALIVTPYYNNPPQKGLYQHYKKIAETVHFPIILYNVPGRTGCDLLPETVAELAKMPNIIGIKEASGKVERITEIASLCEKHFLTYSGADAANLDILSAGAQGVISVTANIAPSKMHLFCKSFLSGDRHSAEKLHHELMPLHKALFIQANPIPVKWALNKMGMIEEGIRLPLIPLEQCYHSELNDALTVTGILSKEKTFI